MATFPTTVALDIDSPHREDHGVNPFIMADGSVRVQSFRGTAKIYLEYSVAHRALTQAEATTVLDFLRANLGVEFTLQDGPHGKTYNGFSIEDPEVNYNRVDTRYDIDWVFRGVEQ